MKYKTLPTTNIKISEFGLGCMSFHTISQGKPIIEKALELGINFFDTADLYDKGENERILGKVLTKKRQDAVIATKVGNRWKNDSSGWDWIPRKKYILKAVEDSLRRLNTDYIDLYQLHGGTIDDPLEEVVEAFELLKKQGKIRAYGISSIRPNTIRKWTALGQAASCMTQYSLLDRRAEEFILDHLAAKGQIMLVRGALAKGLLAGKPAKPYLNRNESEVAKTLNNLNAAGKTDSTISLALHFALKHQAVGAVILGASNRQQLTESVNAYQQTMYEEEDISMLSEKIKRTFYQKHR